MIIFWGTVGNGILIVVCKHRTEQAASSVVISSYDSMNDETYTLHHVDPLQNHNTLIWRKLQFTKVINLQYDLRIDNSNPIRGY